MAAKKSAPKKIVKKVTAKPVAKVVSKKPVSKLVEKTAVSKSKTGKKVSSKQAKRNEYSKITPSVSNNTWEALLFAILFSMIAGLAWWAYQAHQAINDIYDNVDSSVQDQIDRDTYLYRKNKIKAAAELKKKTDAAKIQQGQ